ncbi:MAG: peptide ABC transporter substrate-binding protein [Oscillospiraceae bacterium]|jgi:oligopeptide transport system substrate-binding protein|nr:peptide ABC transporter substrate-binding protein [Oscillospiraceae bacterium]
MKNRNKLLALLLVIALCMGAAPALAGGVLNVQFDVEIASMDPQIATDGTSFEAQSAVIEGLYILDAAGSPIPAIAESTSVSEDGLTYTFTLRDTVWSNGAPVTANDFVFAWRRLVDPAVASEYSFIAGIAGIHNADKIAAGEEPLEALGAVAIDDHTLEVVLDIPVPYFINLLTFPSFLPLSEEFYLSCGDRFATSPETINCNGAFIVTEYEPAANTIVLAKNPDYYDAEKVALDGIRYQVIKDSQQAMLSYQAGDLDVVTLAGEQVDLFKDDPEFQNIMAGYLWYVSANEQTAGLENANIRNAMARAFDKQAVADNILKDGSIPADFAVPKLLATGPDGLDYRATAATYLATDKELALEYWNTGLAELGVSSLSYSLVVEDTESAINVAQFLKAQWEDTLPGLTITIEQMPKKNRLDVMREGEFELGLTRWGPDYADPTTYLENWTTGHTNNTMRWSNLEYDEIIASATKGELTLDPVARWEALKAAEAMVMADAAIYPVYQKGDAVMIKSNVSGIEFHSVGTNRVYKNAVKE